MASLAVSVSAIGQRRPAGWRSVRRVPPPLPPGATPRRVPAAPLRPNVVPNQRSAPCRASAEVDTEAFLWKGEDEYTACGDRRDSPPLPLPAITKPMRVALVRHGQSTWNAEGRIQGSTNFAVLTAKGLSQAETTHEMLENDKFDTLFHSPLARASQTAEIVWGSREGERHVFNCLREVDLYSFQGLLKEEGIAKFGEQFKAWQKSPAEFEIDGHAPVRELWYRGSVAWEEILNRSDSFSTALVVAHNAVNQAMLGTALGLPPHYFRRLLQSNGATTVLDLAPSTDPSRSAVRVTVDRLNQSPGTPLAAGAGRKTTSRIVLVRHAATEGTEDGILMGSTDEDCSPLGEVHAQKTGELLMDTEVGRLFCSPLSRTVTTANAIATYQTLAGRQQPELQMMQDLAPADAGGYTGMRIRDIMDQGGMLGDEEQIPKLWEQTARAWEALTAAAGEDGGKCVVVVAHASVVAGLLCHCLELPKERLGTFRVDPAGVSIVDFPDGASRQGAGNIRCTNYTAHLGRWAVPITRDDLDLVCGIDGCF